MQLKIIENKQISFVTLNKQDKNVPVICKFPKFIFTVNLK